MGFLCKNDSFSIYNYSSNGRVAHIISDKIYERLTGEEGYFDTRIICIAGGPKNQRIKNWQSWTGGANTKYLTLGSELVLTQDLIPQIKW